MNVTKIYSLENIYIDILADIIQIISEDQENSDLKKLKDYANH